MIEGKTGISVKKQQLPGLIPAVNYRDIEFYHKCTGGETYIDLTSLTMPPEYVGFQNPSLADILSAKLLYNQSKLILSRSSGGFLQRGEYKIVSSTRILLNTPALPNEIFEGKILSIPQTGIIGVDVRQIYGQGILPANETDINIGMDFKVGYMADVRQFGEFLLFVEGFHGPLLRNENNSPSGDGNYYEIAAYNGYGSVVRLNESFDSDRVWVAIPAVGIVQRPDNTRDGVLESLAGAWEKVKQILRDDFEYSDDELQANPSYVQMRQFGDKVATLSKQMNSILDVEVPYATDWVQYTPTFNSGFTVGTGGNAYSKWLWRRVGDTIFVKGSFNLGSSGASMGSGDFTVSLPSGLQFDSSKMSGRGTDDNGNAYGRIGWWTALDDTGTLQREMGPVVRNVTTGNVYFVLRKDDGTTGTLNASYPFTWAYNDAFFMEFSGPIQGWSSKSKIRDIIGA